jgi:hypothetical protein
MRRLLVVLTAAVAATALCAPTAALAGVPSAPLVLPGDASASSVRADSRTWLIGARRTKAAAKLARRAGARAAIPGGWVVPRGRARALATALRARGLLTWAEPNRLVSLRQERAVPEDPLSPQARWRDYVADPFLLPPAVTPDSPLLALVDSRADVSHPEFAGGQVATLTQGPVKVSHGTSTAAVAAAPVNGVGIVGVWPGMRALNVPLPADRIRCSDSGRGIARAIGAGAQVINMSYGSPSFCQLEFVALQMATARGISLVAAAGNEFAEGNPLEFPASLPHVLTVGAIRPDGKPAYFSNTSAAMDLAAPGVNILTAVPPALDEDGVQDGYEFVNGTSFAAPMVAAAAAWVRAARPALEADQVAQVIRLSAGGAGEARWNPSTGYGALDVAAALRQKAPPADPLEPNEDIPFVDGTVLDRADRAIFTGRRAKLLATLDLYEDPGDVYRLRVPPRRAVRVMMKPRFGNPDLELYSAGATQVGQRRRLLASSRRPGTRPDRVSYRNRSKRTATLYLRAFIRPGAGRSLDAAYSLTLTPKR